MEPPQLRAILAANIRSGAERRHLTINALADFAGVARSQMYEVLGERRAPTIDWVCKVATALEIEPWSLLEPSKHAAPARRKRPSRKRPSRKA